MNLNVTPYFGYQNRNVTAETVTVGSPVSFVLAVHGLETSLTSAAQRWLFAAHGLETSLSSVAQCGSP